jgi:RNA polymerase sigma-70 factor (ECF subfamily)
VNVPELEQTRLNVLVSAGRGDLAEFAQIYVPFVYRIARTMASDEHIASDVAQAALLDLVKQMPHFRYDPTKRFRNFVRRIVHRRRLDFFRKRREDSLESVARRRGVRPEEVVELAGESEEQRLADDLLDLDRRRARLAAALDEVRGRVRPSTYQAFQLVVMEGQSVERAARILGQTRNQVAQNKHRVVRRLRSTLEKPPGRIGERGRGRAG